MLLRLSSLLLLISFSLRGASLVTQDFAQVENAVLAFPKASAVKVSETIVVFDYDDTLLSPVSVMGGEAWFTWQEGLLKKEAAAERLADDFEDLLVLQNRLLGLVRFKPTDLRIPDSVARIQNAGLTVIVCTSRGPDEMTSTLRELRLSRIDLSASRFSKLNAAHKPYSPYVLKRPMASGLSVAEIKTFDLKEPRTVGFVGGVFFTEGQNKGIMLRTLLHRSKLPVRGIVFIDNRIKHIDRVEAAFKGRSMKLMTIHYNAVDIDTKPFEKGDQAQAEWEKLKHFVE